MLAGTEEGWEALQVTGNTGRLQLHLFTTNYTIVFLFI